MAFSGSSATMPAHSAAARASNAGPEASGRSCVWESKGPALAGGAPADDASEDDGDEEEGDEEDASLAAAASEERVVDDDAGAADHSGRAIEGEASGAGGSRRPHAGAAMTRPAATMA
jgi:hypothetical protein